MMPCGFSTCVPFPGPCPWTWRRRDHDPGLSCDALILTSSAFSDGIGGDERSCGTATTAWRNMGVWKFCATTGAARGVCDWVDRSMRGVDCAYQRTRPPSMAFANNRGGVRWCMALGFEGVREGACAEDQRRARSDGVRRTECEGGWT